MGSTKSAYPFQAGKVYCLEFSIDNRTETIKRLLEFKGEEKPWEDLCSGEMVTVDPAKVKDAIEVPETVVEAIRFSKEKEPIPADLPVNRWEDPQEEDPWERDIYWDD